MKPAHISQIDSIFQNKKWNEYPRGSQAYNRFCDLIQDLSDNENDLIIALTERYLWLSPNQITGHVDHLLLKIENELDHGIRSIYFFPIMRIKDEKKIKSAHHIIYEIKAAISSTSRLRNLTISYLQQFTEINEASFQLDGSKILILVDDFIGTGETLNETFTKLIENSTINNSNLIVFSIAIQSEIYEDITTRNIKSYQNYVINKGISDFYQGAEIDTNKQLMKRIEKQLSINNIFSMGYKESEALVTVKRTPDNTFPIYWKERKPKSSNKFAPFQRD